MGIRNTAIFNKSFLTKQAARNILNSQLLVRKLFKAKYGPDNVRVGHKRSHRTIGQASWGFRSFSSGLEVLRDETAWKVGKGNSIPLLSDRWANGGKIEVRDNVVLRALASRKVSDLKRPGMNKWNEELVNEIFEEESARRIMATECGFGDEADFWYWKHTKDGALTIKFRVYSFDGEINGDSTCTSSKILEKVMELGLPSKMEGFPMENIP